MTLFPFPFFPFSSRTLFPHGGVPPPLSAFVSAPRCAVEGKSKRNRVAAGGDGAICVFRVVLRFTLRVGLLRGIKSHAVGGGEQRRRDVFCIARVMRLAAAARRPPLRCFHCAVSRTNVYPENVRLPFFFVASPFSSSPPLFLRRLPFFFVSAAAGYRDGRTAAVYACTGTWNLSQNARDTSTRSGLM
jgi:hypothetical protein